MYRHFPRFDYEQLTVFCFVFSTVERRQADHTGHSSIAKSRTASLRYIRTLVRVLTTALRGAARNALAPQPICPKPEFRSNYILQQFCVEQKCLTVKLREFHSAYCPNMIE